MTTPEQLAALHAQAFTVPAPWTETDFRQLVSDPTVRLFEREPGFLLLRIAAREAEILTLAVAPEARRQGIGSALIQDCFELSNCFDRIFLEVAANNTPAILLYEKAGFAEIATRTAYYRGTDGLRIDALVMSKGLIPTSS